MKKIKLLAVLLLVSGAFVYNTEKVEAVDACGMTAGPNDVIVNFGGTTLLSNANPNQKTVDTNIPAGRYKITAKTWDDHSTHGGQGQTQEQVFFQGIGNNGNTLFTTSQTNDIPENKNQITTVVSANRTISNTVKKLKAQHSHIGAANYQSVTPVCVKFQRLDDPTPAAQCGIAKGKTYVNHAAISAGQYCSKGTVQNRDGNGTTLTWTCKDGSGDNSKQVSCSANKTVVTPNPVNGQCKTYSSTYTSQPASNTSNGCTAGTYGDVSDTSSGYRWQCAGSNGGSTTSCSANVYTPSNNNLDISCNVSDTRIEEGETVEYYVDINGGDSPYTIDWNGDISGDDRSETVRYNRDGNYDVSVTVEDDDGNRDTASCRTVVVEREDNNNDDLDVQCKVSDRTIQEGETVTFTADVDGGDSPYRYDWSGDISGDDRTERVRFNREGRYEIEIEVRDDDGNRASDTCNIRVEDDRNNNDNNVNVFSNTSNTPSGNLSSVDSVFLSSLPYTGPADVLKVIGFILGLTLWSGIAAYLLLRNKKKKTVSNRIQNFKELNKGLSKIS